MAYKALYRKYRPQTFSEVYGQEHIVETLKGELREGKISHAYLFTGTRGTGKTTCAKILAKAVNCLNPVNGEPCQECDNCKLAATEEATDIVELDAASNNGVDHVRVLREQIAFTPGVLKYRVYIIDEVHMLSIQAFNALLKTLEEPPEHAVFILATTEVHKLPATILSRCQRFDFKRIEPEKIVARINDVAKSEGFTITEQAANLVAAAADGGMRDALSILDLCVSVSNSITESTVTEVCGMSGNLYLNKLSSAIIEGDSSRALTLIDELYNGSVDMLRLATDLSAHFRDIMVFKTVSSAKKPIVCSAEQMEIYRQKAETFNIKDIMRCLGKLSECIASMQNANRRSVLEMTIIELCSPELCSDIASLEKRIRTLELDATKSVKASVKTDAKLEPEVQSAPIMPEPEVLSEPELPEEPEYIAPVPSVEEPVVVSNKTEEPAETPVAEWPEIMKILAQTCPPIFGVLNGSRAFIKGQFLLIDAPNPMFRNMVNGTNSTYRDAIRKAAEKVLGQVYKLGPYVLQKANEADDPLKALAEKLKQFEIPNN